jgi:hypothetical protein
MNRGEWSTAPGTHWRESWVVPRAGMGDVGKTKVLLGIRIPAVEFLSQPLYRRAVLLQTFEYTS